MKFSIGRNISKGVRMASKHWRESDLDLSEKYLNLEKDIMNAPQHYLGIHENCAEYFCNKQTDPEAYGVVAVLKETDVYYEILDACQYYLSNNAKSLIAGYTTNKTENFNSLICKQLGNNFYFIRLTYSKSKFFYYTFSKVFVVVFAIFKKLKPHTYRKEQ